MDGCARGVVVEQGANASLEENMTPPKLKLVDRVQAINWNRLADDKDLEGLGPSDR